MNYYRPDKRYLFTYEEKCLIITDFISKCGLPAELCTIEKDKDGQWRTIDTVQYFKQQYPNDKLFLILGQDSYNDFKTWTRWQDILELVTLGVANRGGTSLTSWQTDVPAQSINMGERFDDCSATRTRDALIKEIIELYLDDMEWYNGL